MADFRSRAENVKSELRMSSLVKKQESAQILKGTCQKDIGLQGFPLAIDRIICT